MVLHFVSNNRGNEHDAKDILQEGMIALWKNIINKKYQPRQEVTMLGYLVKICKYRWYDKLKSASRQRENPLIPEIDMNDSKDILDEWETQDKMKYAQQLLEQLAEKCRLLLRLFYFDEKNIKEIAELMGYTKASAKNEKYRCMMRLKSLHLSAKTQR